MFLNLWMLHSKCIQLIILITFNKVDNIFLNELAAWVMNKLCRIIQNDNSYSVRLTVQTIKNLQRKGS